MAEKTILILETYSVFVTLLEKESVKHAVVLNNLNTSVAKYNILTHL